MTTIDKTTYHKLKNAVKAGIVFVAALHFAFCYAQSPAAYNLSEQYDFNVKTIYGLHQAKDKQVWIATDQGLYAFNGTTFHKYINNAYQSEYSWIKEDREGRIWCRNFAGQLFYVNNDSLILFKDVKAYSIDGLPEFTVHRFPEIYIGTDYGYIVTDFYDRENSKHYQTGNHRKTDYKILPGKDTIYSDYVNLIQPYKNAFIYSSYRPKKIYLLEKSRSKLLFSANNPLENSHYIFSQNDSILFLSERQNQKLRIYGYYKGKTWQKDYNDLPTPTRTVIYYDTVLQKYWLGTNDGAFLLDSSLEPYRASFPFLKGHVISGILRDHEGNYWIGTLQSGIYIIPSLAIRYIDSNNSPLLKDELISMEQVNNKLLILADNQGNIYQYQVIKNELKLLCNVGGGLGSVVYNPINNSIHFSNTFQTYHLGRKQLVPSYIKDIKAGTAIDSIHFLISASKGAHITNFKQDSNAPPMNAHWQQRYTLDHKDNLYNLLTLRAKRSSANTLCKTTGTLYVSYSDGLFFYKNAAAQQITYRKKPLIVTALQPAAVKGVWVATTEGSVFYVDEDTVTPIADFGSEIKHIRQHGAVLFLAGNNGIYTYDTEIGERDVINTLDGLPSNAITGLAIANDTLFAATLKGVVKVPVTYRYKNTVAPEVQLTTLTVNGKPRSHAELLSLSHRENNLRFFFNAYALRSQKTFSYTYRMLGTDSTWTSTQNNSVSFSALSPNNYTFQLKAVNEDGVESSKVEEIRFSIAAPFYQQWWFYGLIVLVSATSVWGFSRYRISTIKKQSHLEQQKKILERQLATSAITTLKAQMNPHFMFNAMTAIQSLILEGEKDEAYTYLTKFSNLIRENLNMSEQPFVYFDREVMLIGTYLKLEKLRFGKDFEYCIEGADAIDEAKIPAMIIQPFVENALKHGLLHKTVKKKLHIVFKRKKALHCIITDNGIGRKAAAAIRAESGHQSFATGAIAKRLALLRDYYDIDLGVAYTDLEENGIPQGTQVWLKIPLFNNRDQLLVE